MISLKQSRDSHSPLLETGFGQKGSGGRVPLSWPMRCQGTSVGEFGETFSILMRTKVHEVNAPFPSSLSICIIVHDVMLGTWQPSCHQEGGKKNQKNAEKPDSEP